MLRISRIAPLLIILAFTASPAAAQAAKSCIGPSSPSALNQYCENIPTATGGTVPGATGIAATLPRQVTRRIQATRASDPRRKLLAIPGGSTLRGSRSPGATGTPTAKVAANLGEVSADPASIGLGLILVLVLSALALVGLALERRRRSGTD